MVPPAVDDVLPLHLATVTFPPDHPLRGQTGDVLGFAVRHPRGVVLFDTGIGTGSDLVDRWYQPVRRSMEDELARHGHRTDDVVAIVNSHLHFDHCGNNTMFPGVPIYAQSDELAAARGPRYTVPDWIDFDGAEYRLIDGEVVIADGIRVIRTPGHTAGHQSIVLETRRGAVVLAGQAVYSSAEYEHIRQHGELTGDDAPSEPEQYLASARRLLELAPRRVHFSHDRAVWDAPR